MTEKTIGSRSAAVGVDYAPPGSDKVLRVVRVETEGGVPAEPPRLAPLGTPAAFYAAVRAASGVRPWLASSPPSRSFF